jgi:probable rRNA maturation factor
MPMTNVTKKSKKPDIGLNLDVLVEDKAWGTKAPRLKKQMCAAIKLALQRQHKFRIPAQGCEIAVILTGDRQIKKLNKAHRGKDYATNVLSFPLHDADLAMADLPMMVGDIVLAYGVIEAEAKRDKKTFTNHFIHLVVHGVLHLCGYDHETLAQARTMERLEKQILFDLNIPDPYRNL